MNELTRIITLQITAIGNADECKSTKEEYAEQIKENLLELGADDVVILSAQDFLMEKKGE